MMEPKHTKKFELKFKLNPKRLVVWVLIIFLFVPFLVSLFELKGIKEEIPLSQALTDIKERKVAKVEVLGETLRLEYKDSEGSKLSRKEANESFTEVLVGAGIDPTSVTYTANDRSMGELAVDLMITALPLILIGMFFLFLLRQICNGQNL